jgi:hypothetical protein
MGLPAMLPGTAIFLTFGETSPSTRRAIGGPSFVLGGPAVGRVAALVSDMMQGRDARFAPGKVSKLAKGVLW